MPPSYLRHELNVNVSLKYIGSGESSESYAREAYLLSGVRLSDVLQSVEDKVQADGYDSDWGYDSIEFNFKSDDVIDFSTDSLDRDLNASQVPVGTGQLFRLSTKIMKNWQERYLSIWNEVGGHEEYKGDGRRRALPRFEDFDKRYCV